MLKNNLVLNKIPKRRLYIILLANYTKCLRERMLGLEKQFNC